MPYPELEVNLFSSILSVDLISYIFQELQIENIFNNDEPVVEESKAVVVDQTPIRGINFSKRDKQEIRRYVTQMLYGSGDVKEPREDTINTLMEMTVAYFDTIAEMGKKVTKGKPLNVTTLYFLISHDRRKRERVAELEALHSQMDSIQKKLMFKVD